VGIVTRTYICGSQVKEVLGRWIRGHSMDTPPL